MERYNLLLRDLISALASQASSRLGPQVSYTAVAKSDSIFGLDGTKVGTVPSEDCGSISSNNSYSSFSKPINIVRSLSLEVYSRVMETCTAMLQHKGTVSVSRLFSSMCCCPHLLLCFFCYLSPYVQLFRSIYAHRELQHS